MRLADSIYCTFGGGSGGADTASSTAPIGQHPEHDGTWDRNKMRKGGKDKGGIVAQKISDPDERQFVQETNPMVRVKAKGKSNGKKMKRKPSLRGTSGGQSEGSSLTGRKFYVVDGHGNVIHTYRTREEADQASAGNRYSKVVTHVEQGIPHSDTPEVRDMAKKRLITPVQVFRRTLPFPGSLGGIYPGSPQGR
jgi:hypothetical protein